MQKIKVSNLLSRNGNFVANQFTIRTDDSYLFQSYGSTIVKVKSGKVFLDEYYWNYSRTTSKYRNIFLNETTDETKRKIKDGEYQLTNLN